MSGISQRIASATDSTRARLSLLLVAGSLLIGLTALPRDPALTFLSLYPGVVTCFMLGGTWPGIWASGLGVVLGAWMLLPLFGGVSQSAGVALAGTIFLAACGLIGVLTASLRAALQASQAARANLEMMALASAESERRYRVLVEDQSEMVSLSDLDGTLTFVNHAYASHFGRSAAEMEGSSLFDYLPPEEHAAVRAHLAEVRQTAGVARGENLMLASDGSGPRWVAWINRALVNDTGQVTGIHSVGRDITEQKTLAAHLAASAQEVADLYEHAPCGYHSVGSHGNYIKINSTELAWLGCERAEVLGRLSPRDFLAPADRERLSSAFTIARSSGHPQQLDCRLIGRHGTQRDVSLNMTVILDEDGTFLMTRSVMFDVSKQKSAERALTRLNHEQSLILDSELFGIARLKARIFVWANAGLERILGYARNELQGVPARAIHANDDSYAAFGALAYGVLQQGRTYRGEVPMRSRDGTALWVEAAGVMLDRDADESLWLFADVTARRRAEEALRTSRSLLERTGAAAGVGGWEYDLRSKTLLWTEETCRIHGMPPGYQPEVARAIEFYAPEARPAIQAALAAAVASGTGYDLELPLQRADGKPIWIRTVGSVEQIDGVPARLIGAIQDVTAKVEQVAHVEHLLALAEVQHQELSSYRDHAEAEAHMASFLLSRLSRIEQLDAAGVQYLWQPAEAFSGDIIAVARSSSGDTYGMLADATGHGLAAAINLIPLTSAFYAMAGKGFNLLTIAEQLNKVVKDYSLADRFVAVTLARFQHREQQLELVNAGNPAALLLDSQGRILRELPSGSIPLGILDRPHFKPVAETIEMHGDETLLLFSDGLVEACNVEGQPFGRAGLDDALAGAASTGGLTAALASALRRHAGTLAPADDVSILVLPATPRPGLVDEDEHTGGGAVATHTLLRPLALEIPYDVSADCTDNGPWSVELRFSSSELRRMEPVPVIVDLCRSFHLGSEVEARMFTVLSELFQNALEHGLLGLDSALKSAPDGFERYLDLREERLAALARGQIAVRVDHRAVADGGSQVQIVVRDTGAGFDHALQLARLTGPQPAEAALIPSGRGLALLCKLCDSVAFNACGNETTVAFRYG